MYSMVEHHISVAKQLSGLIPGGVRSLICKTGLQFMTTPPHVEIPPLSLGDR